jgi:DNA-binding NtrC family response regulator
VDVRVLAATNRDLRRAVGEGVFREDLFYRLNVVAIDVPPLRERMQDVPLLARHFVERYARGAGKPAVGLARETVARLQSHHWPGNVRELEHAIERAVALASSGILLPDDLPPEIGAAASPAPRLPESRMTLDEVKRWYVSRVLEETGGNKLRAAEALGIDRKTLARILDRRGEDEPIEA